MSIDLDQLPYPATAREEQLLRTNQRTSELAYLQRNTYRKVQEVVIKGKTFYHSIEDRQ